MIATEFIDKWKNATNHHGYPAIGIHVNWDKITPESKVIQHRGLDAWKHLYNFYTPWFKNPRTFRELQHIKDADFSQILEEEKNNGKIEYYQNIGLKEPNFCAFANSDQSFILLGDGNHRFFDCMYLIDNDSKNFDFDIDRTQLDTIILVNFEGVIEPSRIWASWQLK